MLWTISTILFAMWVVGLVTSYTLSGFIHIFLLLALIVVILGIREERRPAV